MKTSSVSPASYQRASETVVTPEERERGMLLQGVVNGDWPSYQELRVNIAGMQDDVRKDNWSNLLASTLTRLKLEPGPEGFRRVE
jgi:hypothetical protein